MQMLLQKHLEYRLRTLNDQKIIKIHQNDPPSTAIKLVEKPHVF